MKTSQITVFVAIIAMMLSFTSCSWFGGDKNKKDNTEQQITNPQPTAETPKDHFRKLKRQKKALERQLRDMRKDCEWTKKGDSLEAEMEKIQEAIDDFDCDEYKPENPKAKVSIPRRSNPPTVTAPASPSPTETTPPAVTEGIKLDPGYYEGKLIRFCVRIDGREDLWLPQRLKMDLNRDVPMEDNGIKGNNWVLTEPNGTGPDPLKAVFTADGRFIIPAWMVEEVATKNNVQAVAELKTTKTSWQPTKMRRDGDFYIYP